MAEKIDTGGPARPGIVTINAIHFKDPQKMIKCEAEEHWIESRIEGMTWLDYAAIKIAAGMAANPETGGLAALEDDARRCFILAKLLLAEKRRIEGDE